MRGKEMEKKMIECKKHTSEPQTNGKKIGGLWKTGNLGIVRRLHFHNSLVLRVDAVVGIKSHMA
jgi:hypothetical protein